MTRKKILQDVLVYRIEQATSTGGEEFSGSRQPSVQYSGYRSLPISTAMPPNLYQGTDSTSKLIIILSLVSLV